MIRASESLKRGVGERHLPDQLVAFGISGDIGQGISRLVMTHPSLDERIAALQRRST